MSFCKKIYIGTLLLFLFSVKLQSAHCMNIKIGLITTDKQIIISSTQNSVLLNLSNKQEITKIKNKDSYLIENTNSLLRITNNNNKTKLGAFKGPVKLISENIHNVILYNNIPYRGNLIFLNNSKDKNTTVVNEVDLEDYLTSVVPSEIPYKWHNEALKAQVIAARSYALGFLNRRKEKGYDLESGVEDQVYLGVRAEKLSTSKAVNETKGVLLLDINNNPLIALYHSSGGGYTDSIENLWEKEDIKPSCHIQPRPDYDDNSPYFEWFKNYKLSEINNLLSYLNIGDISKIKVLSRSISKRAMQVEIAGSKGKKVIRGEELRLSLKLPSSKYNIGFEDESIIFAGRGNGHGLGLSQWGAKALAEDGFSYEQILAHYYPGAMLVKRANND